MLRQIWETAWLSAQSDVKGKGDAGALKQDLGLVVGQSEMVTENQAQQRKQGEIRGSSFGWRHRRKRRSRKIPASCDRFCLLFKSSFSFVSIRRVSALLLEKVTPKSHTYTHTHTQMHTDTHTHIQTHTHSSQPTVVSGQWDSSMCTLWNIQLLGQKRERLENHTWASHASTQRWPRWHHPRFIAQNESLRTGNTAVWWAPLSIHILQRNSWEQCCQVFSHWRSFWGSALCRDWMWSYPPWVGLEGISYFHPLACVSPTPYSTSVCAKWD